MFDIVQNNNLIFGQGSIGKIREIYQKNKPSKLLLMVYNLESKISKDVAQILIDMKIDFIADASVTSEPDTNTIDALYEKARTNICDSVLAIGGGSVLDTAKAVAMLMTNGGCTEDYQMLGKSIDIPCLPLIAVPTTAGTGSEATRVCVVQNSKNGLKKSFYSNYMIADITILDPELSVGLPKKITATSGIDALSHAIESYVSLNATPYTEMMGLKAMKLIYDNLKVCMEKPDDVSARGNMLLASYFAGCALNAGIGLAHMIAQPIGGMFKIPHGDACSIFLPYAMEYNAETNIGKFSDIARVFGVDEKVDSPSASNQGIEKVKSFLADVSTPTSLKGYISQDSFEIDECVSNIMNATSHIKCNPKEVTQEIIRKVLYKVI